MTNPTKPRAPRKTKAAKAVDAQVKSETTHEDDPTNKAFSWSDYINTLSEKFSTPAISWKRELSAWVLSLATSFGLGWLMSLAIETVMAAILAFTGSATLTILTWIVGICLTMYAGVKASNFVFLAVRNKQIDAAYENVKSTVSGLFTTQGVSA